MVRLYVGRKYGILLNLWRLCLHIGPRQRKISGTYMNSIEQKILHSTGEVTPKIQFEMNL